MVDHLISPATGYGNACQCASTLNNSAPTQVLISLGENVSKNARDPGWLYRRQLATQLARQPVTRPPIGPLRGDPSRAGGTDRAALPGDQSGCHMERLGRRLGVSADLTGNGKTILKFHYGHYWLYPGVNFTSSFNPNPSGWTQTFVWTNDANRNGRWDPGEEGRLTSSTGGSTSTKLDPDIKNSYVRQATVYLEREAAANLGVRTGFVWNAGARAMAP